MNRPEHAEAMIITAGSTSESSCAADRPPVQPTEPEPADCCGEGCVNCVFDVHEARLTRYQAALATWKARHPEEASNAAAGEPPE